MSTLIQRSFAGGEISPSIYARVDTLKYQTGLKTCRNFFVTREGAVSNRAGSEFLLKLFSNPNDQARLVPFIFNTAQTCVLVFEDRQIKVIAQGVEVKKSSFTITGITKASPAVVTLSVDVSSSINAGDEVIIQGVLGMTEINGKRVKVSNVASHNITLALSFDIPTGGYTYFDTTGYSSYTSGGSLDLVLVVRTPFLEADLAALQFNQSNDVITITHQSYAPQELKRLTGTNWSISPISFVPKIATPTGLALVFAPPAGSFRYQYRVSAVSASGEESLASDPPVNSGYVVQPTVISGGIPLSWLLVTGAVSYNLYRETASGSGVYGFIGTADGAPGVIPGKATFTDTGAPIDTTITAPMLNNPFNGVGKYPACSCYFQQRRWFGSTLLKPETVWGSVIGNFYNFEKNTPTQDDDLIEFTMAGRRVNEVRHLIDLNGLLVLTQSAEWMVTGDDTGAIKPTSINTKQNSYNGSAKNLSPLCVGSDALYVQERGTIVRDLAFDFQADGYKGSDLTIFSSHLFDGFTIVDWCYTQIPHSIVWCVRSDGALLGLTYIKEQQIWAWHRHDFGENAQVLNVTSIPEGDEDIIYLCIKRTIDGVTRKYIERISSRYFSDIKDFAGSDCHLSYDGRNSDASRTMTLSGGVDYLLSETLTLTSSQPFFLASDVGNQIHYYFGDGETLKLSLTQILSPTVAQVRSNKTVDLSLRLTPWTQWARAVDQIFGLGHLEGEEVSVLGDGFVVASPLNSQARKITVILGQISLNGFYAVVRVGLPITADIETLDVDTSQGETLADKKKRVASLHFQLSQTRGIFAGIKKPDPGEDPLEGLFELKVRSLENLDDPVKLLSQTAGLSVEPRWTDGGGAFIRQVDPLPVTILSIMGSGNFPVQR